LDFNKKNIKICKISALFMKMGLVVDCCESK